MAYTWNPFRELDALHRELDRAFERWGVSSWNYPFSRVSFLPGRAARAYPLLNVGQDSDNVYVEALMPGVDPTTLNTSIKGDQLTIEGEKKSPEAKPEAWHRNERFGGRFVRTLTLPSEIEADKISAEYQNGMLKMKLPKAEVAKPKRIEVKVG